jgi:Raf kinase inhibitor-like YbhB/YbcL family protein
VLVTAAGPCDFTQETSFMRLTSTVAALSFVALGLAPVLAQTLLMPTNDVMLTPTPGFRLSSPDLKNGTFAPAQVLNTFGCTGGNVSPQIVWTGAPGGAKSFVLTMFDPDAPTGSGFWHWVVANIPPTATGIPQGASKTPKMPAGSIETQTDIGTPGYAGPCPPAGTTHRYVLTLYALSVDKIDVTADASGALVGFNTRAHVIGVAQFTATYGR